jgi:hypothetical protein
MMAQKSEHPTAANHRLRLLRALMAHAVKIRMIPTDPCLGIRKVPYKTDGYHTWTDDEIATFEAKYPSGSRERLAFALLLYTGQRRSDVVRMGRQHIREIVLEGRRSAAIEVTQVKTSRRLLVCVTDARAALGGVARMQSVQSIEFCVPTYNRAAVVLKTSPINAAICARHENCRLTYLDNASRDNTCEALAATLANCNKFRLGAKL